MRYDAQNGIGAARALLDKPLSRRERLQISTREQARRQRAQRRRRTEGLVDERSSDQMQVAEPKGEGGRTPGHVGWYPLNISWSC